MNFGQALLEAIESLKVDKDDLPDGLEIKVLKKV